MTAQRGASFKINDKGTVDNRKVTLELLWGYLQAFTNSGIIMSPSTQQQRDASGSYFG